jgi:hypothetical protein
VEAALATFYGSKDGSSAESMDVSFFSLEDVDWDLGDHVRTVVALMVILSSEAGAPAESKSMKTRLRKKWLKDEISAGQEKSGSGWMIDT